MIASGTKHGIEPDTADRLDGKVCLITGATGGIGLASASELARRGARVVLAGRVPERCDSACAAVRRSVPGARVESLVFDLSLQRDLRRAAAEISARHDRLDTLINNAGALFALRAETDEHVERTLATNHVGPFLLTNLLLPLLRRAPAPRVVVVASSAHADVPGFDFDDPHASGSSGRLKRYPRSEAESLFFTLAMPWAHPGYLQYARTKLANLLFAYEAARRFAPLGVAVSAVHPGLVASGFGAGNGTYGRCLWAFLRVFGASPERGARALVRAATGPAGPLGLAGFAGPGGPAESAPASHDRKAQARLWERSAQLVGTI